MTPEEFAAMTIDKPWMNRAEGMDAYDCQGLVNASYRLMDGVELPSVAGYLDPNCPIAEASAPELNKPHWHPSTGIDGDVAWYFNANNEMVHVGRVILGGVLHAFGKDGVGRVKWQNKRILSRYFTKTEYRRYANNCTAGHSKL